MYQEDGHSKPRYHLKIKNWRPRRDSIIVRIYQIGDYGEKILYTLTPLNRRTWCDSIINSAKQEIAEQHHFLLAIVKKYDLSPNFIYNIKNIAT